MSNPSKHKSNALTWRGDATDALSGDLLDMLIVGGGIVGAGIARDGAMRGLRVGLIEQYDFAWGTSSRSSRLLHGGIRYLAQARLGLVRQASVEKRVIGRIAPHLVDPLPFVFPTYRGTPWPLWKLRMGVRLYDLLCSGRNYGKCSVLSVDELGQRLPGVDLTGATGAVRYFDGATNDARLVIDTLRSAARHGAIVCNYMKLEEAARDGEKWCCRICDAVTGRAHKAVARCVVNATGPWADTLEHSRIRIRGTKGIHLVLDGPSLPIDEALMMTEGPRVAYAIPWGERVYIGTTDTDFEGRPEDVRSDPEDVAYLLTMLNRYFPDANLDESDVVRTWAGVRPLIADSRGKPSDVSRSHEIHIRDNGWVDVAGGKLTTYRLMARQVIDRLHKYWRVGAPPCRTADEPLLAESELLVFSGIVPPSVEQTVIQHACHAEWAVHLDDVMVRRTRWHHYHSDTATIAQQATNWMAAYLDWSDARRYEELRRYEAVLD